MQAIKGDLGQLAGSDQALIELMVGQNGMPEYMIVAPAEIHRPYRRRDGDCRSHRYRDKGLDSEALIRFKFLGCDMACRPIQFGKQLQQQVILSSLDDFAPVDVFPGLLSGEYGARAREWRDAVIQYIELMLISRLIVPLGSAAKYAKLTPIEIVDLLREGDPTTDVEAKMLWNSFYFDSTEELRGELSELNLLNWSALNASPCHKLAAFLARCGVALEEREVR